MTEPRHTVAGASPEVLQSITARPDHVHAVGVNIGRGAFGPGPAAVALERRYRAGVKLHGEALADALLRMCRRYPGLFVTLNPPRRAMPRLWQDEGDQA